MCSVQWSVTDALHCVQLTLNYAHLNGMYQVWGVIATLNGIVYQPPWTFRPSSYARRLPIETYLVSNRFYKSSLTNYVFGVAMGGFLLKLQNFKKVKLIFGHPVLCRKVCRTFILQKHIKKSQKLTFLHSSASSPFPNPFCTCVFFGVLLIFN